MATRACLLAGLLALGLAGCDRPVPEGPQFKLVASLQDLMTAIVDPAADTLWDSVGSVSTAAGIEERQPRSDEEWLAVRRHAVTLVESANLLLLPGRAVTAAGRQVDDAHVAGVLDAAAVRRRIDADPAGFATQARRFGEAAEKALLAVDARNVPNLLEAGGQLQEACESCHARYWYPQALAPRS